MPGWRRAVQARTPPRAPPASSHRRRAADWFSPSSCAFVRFRRWRVSAEAKIIRSSPRAQNRRRGLIGRPEGESLGSRGEAIAPVTPPAQGRIRSASPWPMGVTWRARPSFRDSPLGGHRPQLGDPALLAPSGVPLGIGHRRLAVPLGFRLGEAALLLSSARKGKRSGGSQLLGW